MSTERAGYLPRAQEFLFSGKGLESKKKNKSSSWSFFLGILDERVGLSSKAFRLAKERVLKNVEIRHLTKCL